MSVLLALAIIIAIIAVVCAVKAVRAIAAKTHADEQSVVEVINQDCMEAVVMVLAYTKSTLKAQRLSVRRARSANAAMYRSNGLYIARGIRSAMMDGVTYTNAKAIAKADERKALARAHNAPSATYAQLGACGIKAAKRAALGIKVATHKRVVPVVNTHVCTPAVVRTIKRVPTIKAANKPTIISGTQLAEQARATGTSLAAQIRVAKTTLASLYAILPLARQVVALQNKASRKVGMYTWLADEGHVGMRATKSSVARRDAAQDIVCQATLAAEAFKEAYGIEASEVVSQILVVKAAKARAAEMLRDHKAEQHRLFVERQERRAAKSALRASKTAPITSPAVTEVADWEKYVPMNCGNKAIASSFLNVKTATVSQKAAAIAVINGLQDYNLTGKCTTDAAYGVAA